MVPLPTKEILIFFTCLLISSCCHGLSKVEYFQTQTLAGVNNNYDKVAIRDAYMQLPTGLCLGLNNDIFVSDVGRHLIFRIVDMSIVEIYAGFGLSGFNGDGYSNLKTLFNTPTSISQNPLNGDLYIADTLNDKIRMVSNSTKLVSSLQYSFNKPQGVFVTKNGNIYIADTGNNLIKKYEISTQKLSIIAGGGYLSGIQQEIDGADGTSLILNSPKSLYVVSNGKNEIVYFTDADRVRSVDENGKFRIVDQNSPQSNL